MRLLDHLIPRRYRKAPRLIPRAALAPLALALAVCGISPVQANPKKAFAEPATPIAVHHLEHDTAAWLASPLVGAWIANKMAGGGNRAIALAITSNRDASVSGVYDIFVQAGSPTDAVDVLLTIATGIWVVGNPALDDDTFHRTDEEAIRTGTGWATGSTIKVVNLGYWSGRGGYGGHGRNDSTYNSWNGYRFDQNGESGGDAFYCAWPTTIDNTNGYLWGGGGGGGGGGGEGTYGGHCASGGGGAGARFFGGAGPRGEGSWSVQATSGTAGTSTAAGSPGSGGQDTFSGLYGGSGGNAGAPGEYGSAGAASAGAIAGGNGGPYGYSVRYTGAGGVTFTGGNNSTQRKGPIGS